MEQSEALLAEMSKVNQALRFAAGRQRLRRHGSEAIEMDAVMQDLAAELTRFEDRIVALMDIIADRGRSHPGRAPGRRQRLKPPRNIAAGAPNVPAAPHGTVTPRQMLWTFAWSACARPQSRKEASTNWTSPSTKSSAGPPHPLAPSSRSRASESDLYRLSDLPKTGRTSRPAQRRTQAHIRHV